MVVLLFAILQKYDFSSKSQRWNRATCLRVGCLRYCKSTIFQANHNIVQYLILIIRLFAILQKYDFSSKSQLIRLLLTINVVVCDTAKVRFFKQITTDKGLDVITMGCLRYCKSTIFQANHNVVPILVNSVLVVCDTAKVRFFKQITTEIREVWRVGGCLRYCKSTIFQANHNVFGRWGCQRYVVCDTAKVRFFKQITTG